MKIVVIGKTGQLARYLRKILPENTVFLSRNDLDLVNITSVYNRLFELSPDVIINASAYTNTTLAETEQPISYAVNSYAVAEMARLANTLNSLFIHISTDYVFDGNSEIPYKEEDQTNPQNIYGASKLLGESLSLSLNKKTIIIRTSWVFSEYGNNFVKTIFNLSKQKKELDVVCDEFGSPTYAGSLAVVVNSILNFYLENENIEYGVYNYSDSKSCSWYELAESIINIANKNKCNVLTKTINPVKSSDWESPILRPKNAVLDCSKIKNKISINQTNWLVGLEKVILNLAKTN